MCPVEIMKSLKAQISKAAVTQCAQAQLNTSQCSLRMCPSPKQLSTYQLRSVAAQAEHFVAMGHRATSPGLPWASAASQAVWRREQPMGNQRKNTGKQMSRQGYNEESAETGTGWGKRKERMGSLRLGAGCQCWMLNTEFLSQEWFIFRHFHNTVPESSDCQVCAAAPECPMAEAEGTATTGVPTTAKLKNWAEAKALPCWRAQCSPWEHMGLLLAYGGWDHLEGPLCTAASYPEKVCARYEKVGSTVRERSHLALEPGQLCLG